MPKFSTKYPLFKYFWPRLYQNYCHSRTQHHQIGEIVKFREKKNYLNLGPQMPYLGIFGFLKNFCDILNSAPSNLTICNFLR